MSRRSLLSWLGAGLLVGALACPAGAQEAKAKQAEPEARDAFGRVMPWADAVNGARVRLRVVRTRLLYGEPLGFIVESRHVSEQGPYVRLNWDGDYQTLRLELTTDRGEAVPFTRQLFGRGDSTAGGHHTGRLWPGGKFALGRYLAPGSYRLRLVVDARRNKLDANSWEGKIVTPEIAIEVIAAGAAARRELVPPALREKAAGWIRDLDSAKFAEREAADKALRAVALDVLPLLEEKLREARRTEDRIRAQRIVGDTLAPLLRSREWGAVLPQETGPVLALLGEESWNVLRERSEGPLPEQLPAIAAAFAPVGPYRDLTRPTEKDVAEIVARLRHERPAERVRAVRALTKTADRRVLDALAQRLADSYTYHLHGPGHPVPFALVAHEAAEALAWQGNPAVDAVTAFGRANPDSYRRVAEVLAGIGPDKRSAKFLGELMANDSYEVRWSVAEALGKLGPPAAPHLLKAAGDAKELSPLRREAIKALGRLGDAKVHGPFLLEMLKNDNAELQGAAVEAVAGLKLAEALPELMRLARDTKADTYVRCGAMHAVKRLAPRKEAEALLLELLDRKQLAMVRSSAMVQLAFLNCRKAVPPILDALDDADDFVRRTADSALRILSGRREGVGYDPRRPEPQRWRDWWKEKQR